MADGAPTSRFAFLYRQGEGVLDASQWARAAWPPAAIALAVVGVWVLLAPGTPEPLSDKELAGPTAVVALAYFIAYMLLAVLSIFFVLLLAVAEYFVCAKRFRARSLPTSLAGLAPFSILFAWAVHWYVRTAGDLSVAVLPAIFAVVAALICGWSIFELGFRKPTGT
jgi:hypothetical protein